MSTQHFVYLLGGPGAGKTTILERLLDGPDWEARNDPLAHRRREHMIWLGRERRGFGGTDTLPMNIAPTAEAWIASLPAAVVIGEGDRLSYPRFFDVAASAGYRMHLIYLAVPQNVSMARRSARADALQIKLQNPSWVKGRESKAYRLARQYHATWLNANRPADRVVDDLRLSLRQAGNPLGDIAVS